MSKLSFYAKQKRNILNKPVEYITDFLRISAFITSYDYKVKKKWKKE